MAFDQQTGTPFQKRIIALRNRWGFACVLLLLTGSFLLSVGLRPDALPFPPGSTFSDAVVSHWPNALFLQRSLQNNQWPLWRDQIMSGQPFATNPLNKVWYPPQWLVLFLPVTLHLNLLIWGHLILAGLGMRAFLRRLDLPSLITDISGIAYALSPRLVATIGAGHLDIVYAMAWLPWIMWAVDNAVRGSGSPWRRSTLLGLITSMCFFADLRMSVFFFGLAGSYGLFLLTKIRSPQIYRILLGSLFLLIGITAIQWIPLMEIYPYLSRSGLTLTDAAFLSLQPAQLIGVLIPRQPGSFETLVYSGLIVMISVIIGTNRLWRTKRRDLALFLLGIITFSALYALGNNGPLWGLLARLIPLVQWLRVPPRIWIVAVFALVTLAAFGMQAINETLRHRKNIVISILGALIILELLYTDVSVVVGKPQSVWLDAYTPLVKILQDAGVQKLYSPTYSLPQQVAAYWNIPDLGGVDPFQLRSYVTSFQEATGTQITGYTVTLPPLATDTLETANQEAIPNAALLAQWGVSHILAAYPITADGFTLVRTIDSSTTKLYLYHNDQYESSGAVWSGPNCVSMSTKQTTIKRYYSAWAPGWTLPNDGTGLLASDQPSTGCYAPNSTMLGLVVSVVSTVAAGMALRMGKRRQL